jgi:segregation and condensation protein A
MGVTVTFVAILELVREGLIDIVQTEAYAPLHVRSAQGARGLKLAVDNDAQLDPAANEQSFTAAPTDALPDDDDDDDAMDGGPHE